MWSVFSVVALLSIFESVFTDNQNETAQNQTGNDFVGAGATFARNLTAAISVSDSHVAESLTGDKVNISEAADRNQYNRGEALPVEIGKSRNIPTFQPGYYSPSASNQNSNSPKPASLPVNRDSPWISRVKFPSDSTNPYPFEPSNPKPSCCQTKYQPHPDQNAHADQKIVEHTAAVEPSRPSLDHHSYLSPKITSRVPIPLKSSYESSGRGHGGGKHEEFNFNKLVEVPKKYYSEGPTPNHKTFETSYNLMEKPSHEVHEKTYGGGYYSPWKKILKLLATVIPIGVLISALTPTVIHISNVNETMNGINGNTQSTRYRSVDDSKKELQNHILSSLEYFDKLNENGCEYRVFCELLATASHMPDSEKHVQNLLDNFAKQEIDYKSRADDLKKVFEAVRNQDCSPITCAFIDLNQT